MKRKRTTIKKILSFLLVAVMTVGIAPLNGFVGLEFPNFTDLFSLKSKAYSENQYYYDVVDGKAEIYACDYSYIPVYVDITIPSTLGGYPVTSIGDRVFLDCDNLTSITIPDGVTYIGNQAFSYCENLESITIPDSVTSIGSCAFSNCENLESITIPDSVTNIYSSTFKYCTSLRSIKIPDSVTNIGNYAFYGCMRLKELAMPVSAEIYNSKYTFYNCYNIEKITLTKGNGTMKNYCTSTSSSTETCYQYTPWYISRGKEVIIEDGVSSIGNYAFKDCFAIESVTIPESLTTVGHYAFDSCLRLKDVYYSGSKTDKQNIEFGYYNDFFNGATWHCQGHDHTPKTITADATCIQDGEIRTVCSECNEVLSVEVIPALGHKYNSVVTTPTCTKKGYTTYTCSVCNNSYVDNYVVALGHTDGEWKVIDEPTCEEDGVKKCYCTVCGELTKEETINSLGHSYVTEVTAPTCIKKGYTTYTCSVCNESYAGNYVDALGHTDGEWKIIAEPTYKKEGVKALYCSVCGDIIKTETIDLLTPEVLGMELDKESILINRDDTIMLTPEIEMGGEPQYTVTYSSSNEKVATVDGSGNVIGKMKGNAVITCTVTDADGNMFTDICDVTVNFTFVHWLLYIICFGWIWM